MATRGSDVFYFWFTDECQLRFKGESHPLARLVNFSHHTVSVLKRKLDFRTAVGSKINPPIDLTTHQNDGNNNHDDRRQTRPPPLHTDNHSGSPF
jgi:hypothetical protein